VDVRLSWNLTYEHVCQRRSANAVEYAGRSWASLPPSTRSGRMMRWDS